SCHRILTTLADIQETCGLREVVVARELTKKFEEIKHGLPEELIKYFKDNKPRGEFVIVISPA
ncbi:MAG: 16S rRNA (cytidine(1402)-2'-O)-methyltransferase, partial [Candidatus Omnitrophica bacterium]|nr:16S rRNA (cytidine(1402)-2'-O)-methyltransferase [Candidatus Omnitrophota bacterium]